MRFWNCFSDGVVFFLFFTALIILIFKTFLGYKCLLEANLDSIVCVFTFWVPCCNVRYDFRIKTIFGSSLPPVVSRKAHVYLRYLCCLRIVVSNTYCVVVIALIVSSCILSGAGFSGLSILDCPFGIFSRLCIPTPL